MFYHEKTGRLYYLFENKQVILDIPKKVEKLENQSINVVRKQYSRLPCKIGLVKSSIGIDLLKNLQPIDKSDEEALKTGNKFKLEYKSKMYILNSSEKHQVYELIKKFSSCKDFIIDNE